MNSKLEWSREWLSRCSVIRLEAGIWRIVIKLLVGGRDVALLQRVQIDSEAHKTSKAMGTAGIFSGLKWPGRKCDRLPASSFEFKNECSCTITPQ